MRVEGRGREYELLGDDVSGWGCTECGAIVYDSNLHDEWHKSLKETRWTAKH